jgi:hypothetical protein
MKRRREERIKKEKNENRLLDGFANSLFEWSQVWGFTSSASVLDFTSSLSLISYISLPVIP